MSLRDISTTQDSHLTTRSQPTPCWAGTKNGNIRSPCRHVNLCELWEVGHGSPSPIASMGLVYFTYRTYIWLIFMVNVGKYTIHMDAFPVWKTFRFLCRIFFFFGHEKLMGETAFLTAGHSMTRRPSFFRRYLVEFRRNCSLHCSKGWKILASKFLGSFSA